MVVVCLCGLREFPVRWLDFGPLSFSLYLYSCSCCSFIVGPRRLLKVTWYHGAGSRQYRLASGHVKYAHLIYMR